MRERCPGARPLASAVAPGYKLSFAGYATKWKGAGACIVPEQSGQVYGGLYEISEEELDVLDAYETLYERGLIRVINHEGVEQEAITYIKLDEKDTAQPSEIYVLTILRGFNDFKLPSVELARTLIRHQFPCRSFFVYGTLKTNGPNHARFMTGFKTVTPAIVHGYEVHSAMGMSFIRPVNEGVVQGEYFTFSDEENFNVRLSRVDKFEWFDPAEVKSSFYERVLVAAVSNDWPGEKLAWAYAAGERVR